MIFEPKIARISVTQFKYSRLANHNGDELASLQSFPSYPSHWIRQMKLLQKTGVLVVMLTLAICVETGNADAGNGWGWAKPLNQKAGSILYTTNRKAKTNYRPSVRRTFPSRYARTPVTYSRVYAAPAVRYPITTVAPSILPHHNVIVKPPVIIHSVPGHPVQLYR